MKNGKLVLCLAGLLLLAMLVDVVLSPLAQAQSSSILKWAEVYTPGKRGEVIVTPSEISRIAASRGDVLYAIDSDSTPGGIYRSDNGGLTWTDITKGLVNAGALLPPREIAVAPESPQIVAVVTNSRKKVYVSTDSGASWHDTGVPGLGGATIQCITISKGYLMASNLVYDIAIGTAGWGNATTTGQVWVLRGGALISTWRNQNTINQIIDPSHTGAEVSAIVFSPKYADDGTILAVASTAADGDIAYQNKTWLCIGQRDLSSQTTLWNSPAGYPVEIAAAGDDAALVSIISSISLPSDYVYVETDPTSMKVFVGYNRQPDITSANDVYGIDNTTVYRLKAVGGASIDLCSISYYGTVKGGKLLAGDVNSTGPFTVRVRRAPAPFATDPPSTAWNLANQPPSGPGNAQVAWSYGGRMAFCGTSQSPGVALDESAFSRSVDDGDTWEQTSLIDTVIHISDIAPAPDSKSLFLATYSVFGVEGVWRSAGEPLGNFWGRLLTMNTDSDRIILRLSPDYSTDYTIYTIELGGYKMMVSHNRGNSWQQRYVPGPVVDLAVEDKDTIYVALPAGYIRKNTNAGAAWLGPEVNCFPEGAAEVNMLTVVDKGHILVGSRDCRVAYSDDGGSSFTEISQAVGNSYRVAGDVQVVADANYSENRIIYAATNIADDGVWRWAIGTSTEWEQIDDSVTSLGMGQRISGLVTCDEGTLYALRSEPVDGASAGGMTRTLNPWQLPATLVEFDIVNATLPTLLVPIRFDPLLIFPNTLPHLKLSGNTMQNELWSVDTANDIIYRFQDNVCKNGPFTMASGGVGCDPVSGRAQEVNLCWEQLSLADAYDIEVAKDEGLSVRVFGWVAENWCQDFLEPADVTKPCVFIPASGRAVERAGSSIAQPGNLECGHAYYWRLRVRHAATGEVIRSPWSEVRSFAVKAGLPVRAEYYGPRLLSPDNGCIGCAAKSPSFSWSPFKETTKYRFVLAKDAAMTQVIVQATVGTTAYQYKDTLDSGTNYFWQVMALEPVPSDWSATFSFQTEASHSPPTVPEEAAPVPLWVWAVIAIGTILAVITIVLIYKTK